MAVSKHTRASGCETNPFFLNLFRDNSESDDRERLWHVAMTHAGEGAPPLRFPVYECLYLINVHAQKLVELIDESSRRFGVDQQYLVYYQSLIQYVRAAASQDILDFMSEVEPTEEWLFDEQRAREERKFRDREDTDLEIRADERVGEELQPPIQSESDDEPD